MVDETERGSGIERIRDAAIDLFGERGFRGTSLKAIAEEAGVSQALIVHHFGSKDGLRAACTHHVAEEVRATKSRAMREDPRTNPFEALRWVQNRRSLLRYLARTVSEGGPHLDSLLDEFIADGEEYMAEGVRAGWLKPSRDPRGRTVLLTLWSFGALVLHEQVERLLGVDLLAEHQETIETDLSPYLGPALELYAQGLLQPDVAEQLLGAFPPREEP